MNVKDSKRCPVVGTSALKLQGVRPGKIISFDDIRHQAEHGEADSRYSRRYRVSFERSSHLVEPTVSHGSMSVVDDLLNTTALGCSDAVCSIAYEDARGISFGLLTKYQSLLFGAGLVALMSIGMFFGI